MKPKQAKQKPVDVTHLRDLTPDPQNARQHNPRNIGTIVDSLHEVGAARSIVIDENNVVLAGNGVVEAAGEAGIENVRVVEASGNEIIAVRRRGLTDLQKKRLALFDNRAAELAEWSPEELSRLDKECPEALEGLFHDDELEAILDAIETPAGEADAEPQIDRAAELNKKWQVKLGDLWRIGEHRLLCGDSTKREDVEQVMGGGMAVMCFTDPPWNVAIGQDSNPRHRQRKGLENDSLSAEDFAAFLSGFAGLIPTAVTGDLYCVLGASEWPSLDLALRSAGFHWSATVIWVKDIFVLGRSKYHRRYEPLWYGWHKDGKSSFCDARDLDDVWEIKRPRVSEEHPTMKPVELVVRAVTNSSKSGDAVYEPFCGSGTTMVACENLKRKCRGIEISPDYCAVILERMQTAFPKIKIERIGK
jgi:DNA modification methylase